MDPSQFHQDGAAADVEAERPFRGGLRLWCRVAVVVVAVALTKGLMLAVSMSCLKLVTCERELMLAEELAQCHADLDDLALQLRWQGMTCPRAWLFSKGRCYFFSVGQEEDRSWHESVEFCMQQHAQLVIIDDQNEMAFIVKQMRRYQQLPFLWVGLSDILKEGQWVWLDGTPHQNHTLASVSWDTEQMDCADVRADGALFATDCQTAGPWLCEGAAERTISVHHPPP